MDMTALALAFGTAWSPVAVTVPKGVPAGPVVARPVGAVFDASGAARSWAEAVTALASARIVAVGESHDDAGHHALQAEVLTALAARVPLAVGLEMVQAEDQAVLDAFMSGATTEADFAVWWKINWGFDFALYKPIFDAARIARVPVRGLNAPREVVKAVGKKGLAGLTPAERGRIPAVILESADARYRKYVLDSVSGHGAPPAAIPRMLEAMAVWNETMGENAAKLAAEGRVVLVIAGQGHVFYKAGILESAARRGAGPAQVLLPWSDVPQAGELPLADWFRVTP
ncbi:MAG: ChaN family lipoprotein [Elusimicrobiota bacterium]|nr:ChaN family lipoprotein [Elusimicrobiota bacterium]